MPIANAVQRGSSIIIYDDKGRIIGSVPAYDGLHGFTAVSVTVRSGSSILIYNEKGRLTGSTPYYKPK